MSEDVDPSSGCTGSAVHNRDARELPVAGHRSRPMVLTRRTGSSVIVAQVCPRAAAQGLRPGLTLGQAQALVPELAAREVRPHEDETLLQRLADWALRFSPSVQPSPPDTLLLDITGCERLFGSEASIVQQAVGGLLRQGLHARAAIADTPAAAYALASASDGSLVVVPEGQASAYLAPLPPAALRIEPRTCEQLHALGVRTIGDLLTLPRSTLPARFGLGLVRRMQQALGEVFEPLAPQQQDEPPKAETAFESAVQDRQTLASVIGPLLEELYEQLVRRELALRSLDCILIHEHAPPTVLRIGLSRASRAWKHITELTRRRLESADLRSGADGVCIVARETSRWKGKQADLFEQANLFEQADPDTEEAFGCLLDRLVNRLGADAIVRAELVDDYQPEAAYRYTRRCEGEKVKTEERKRNSPVPTFPRSHVPAFPLFHLLTLSPSHANPRPTCLLPRPLPIRVIALVPDGPPTWMAIEGSEHVVVGACGPERIETGWWRGPDVRRDYFRIASESGEQFWVFHIPGESRWFLHGMFQ